MSSGRSSRPTSQRIRFRTDFEKQVIVSNFERRGWAPCQAEYDWNVYWASVGNVKQWFNPESGIRLADDQVISHFPNHWELTRKDMMVKNLKRYRKDAEKALVLLHGDRNAEAVTSAMSELDFLPTTYSLPADYSLFVEEFRRNGSQTWIVKPANAAQGRGIFLINKLSQVKKWANSRQLGAGGPPIRSQL